MTNGLVGFFRLQTPEDLLMKLQRDCRRLRENPADSDAAFDFFVTATHMPDWCAHAGRPPTPPMGRDKSLVAICKHLGNGAKHFAVNRHEAVQHGDIAPVAYGLTTYGHGIYGATEMLVVTLAPDEAADFESPDQSALGLAAEVLEYWSRQLGVPST